MEPEEIKAIALEQMIAVMTAAKEGKAIQVRSAGYEEDKWHDCYHPNWDWVKFDYRVKPEPRKPREFWVNVYKSDYTTQYAHTTKQSADLLKKARFECIHVREVLNDNE